MITTFQALAVAALAVLPGASYTFAYERRVGAFGVSLSDRLVRFLAVSAFFLALSSGLALWLYRDFVVNGRLARGDINAIFFTSIVVTYVLLPSVLGWLMGHGQNQGWRWVLAVVGDSPEPRAWDYLWRPGVQGVVRIKLKSGPWLGGIFATSDSGRRSYAAGYPEDGDLYLSRQVQVDPVSGAFVRDDQGRAVPADGNGGLLLRWEEVEYLELQEFTS